MIHHIVSLDLREDHDPAELAAIMAGLDDLRNELPGFEGFAHGPNRDFEGMSPDCAYVFICRFSGEDVSRRYLVHPGHTRLGARLVALCKGGVEGIRVMDMDVGP